MTFARLAWVILFLVGGCPDSDDEFSPWELEELSAEQGLSIRIPEFAVPAGKEIQDCYFFAMPEVNGPGQDIWIDRIVTAINPGSHHLNVFRVATIVMLDPAGGTDVELGTFDGAPVMGKLVHGETPMDQCFRSSNWADWPLVANSQNSSPDDPLTDWTLPDDVAHKFVPGEMLMVQTHYVNAGTQETPNQGKVGINLYKTPARDTLQELGTLFATQQSISICQSDPIVEYHGTCRFPAGSNLTITAANGHFHSRGTEFDMYTWDGISTTQPDEAARFYQSTTWDDPPMARDMDLVAPPDGGVWWTCHYRWQEPLPPSSCDAVNARDMLQRNDCCYTFGPVVETSEHCNAFLYYWPKVARSDIFCN